MKKTFQLSEQEKLDIANNELMIKEKRINYKIIVLLVLMFAMLAFMNYATIKCEMLFGLHPVFWMVLGISVFAILYFIIMVCGSYKAYQKSLKTGFIKDTNRKNKKIHFFIKADPNIIARKYRKSLAYSIFFIVAMFFMTFINLKMILPKTNVQSSSYLSIKDYQIASQIIQHECLAKKSP